MTEVPIARVDLARLHQRSIVRTIFASIVLAFMFAGCSTLPHAQSAPPNPFDGMHGQ